MYDCLLEDYLGSVLALQSRLDLQISYVGGCIKLVDCFAVWLPLCVLVGFDHQYTLLLLQSAHH